MKKLFDRRMVGYLVGVGCIAGLAAHAPEGTVTMGMNLIIGMYGILVTGNVVEKIKAPNAT